MTATPVLVVPAPLPPVGEQVVLPEAEARHVHVRRLRDGDLVTLIDGLGGRGAGFLLSGGTAVRLERLLPTLGEPDVRVTVVLPAAEPARVEWAVEKGTECGAAGFSIAVFERSQRSHVAALTTRLSRLRRVAAEAAKQCGRTVVPPVSEPVSYGACLEECGAVGPILLLTQAGPPIDVVVPGRATQRLVLVVGPEGGFTDAEREGAVAGGAVEAGLGPRTLRLETAVVVALARLVDRAAR